MIDTLQTIALILNSIAIIMLTWPRRSDPYKMSAWFGFKNRKILKEMRVDRAAYVRAWGWTEKVGDSLERLADHVERQAPLNHGYADIQTARENPPKNAPTYHDDNMTYEEWLNEDR